MTFLCGNFCDELSSLPQRDRRIKSLMKLSAFCQTWTQKEIRLESKILKAFVESWMGGKTFGIDFLSFPTPCASNLHPFMQSISIEWIEWFHVYFQTIVLWWDFNKFSEWEYAGGKFEWLRSRVWFLVKSSSQIGLELQPRFSVNLLWSVDLLKMSKHDSSWRCGRRDLLEEICLTLG